MMPPTILDAKGRCCGKRPILYIRPPHWFCPKCDRAYNMAGEQIENWAWRHVDHGFEQVYPKQYEAMT